MVRRGGPIPDGSGQRARMRMEMSLRAALLGLVVDVDRGHVVGRLEEEVTSARLPMLEVQRCSQRRTSVIRRLGALADVMACQRPLAKYLQLAK